VRREARGSLYLSYLTAISRNSPSPLTAPDPAVLLALLSSRSGYFLPSLLSSVPSIDDRRREGGGRVRERERRIPPGRGIAGLSARVSRFGRDGRGDGRGTGGVVKRRRSGFTWLASGRYTDTRIRDDTVYGCIRRATAARFGTCG